MVGESRNVFTKRVPGEKHITALAVSCVKIQSGHSRRPRLQLFQSCKQAETMTRARKRKP